MFDSMDGYFSSQITIDGCDGSHWIISGPGRPDDAGVTLNPNLVGAIDAPVKTLWLPGAFGQEAQGFRWQRRDMVFAVQTFADDPETWLTVDSNWRFAWDYVKPTKITYTTSAGSRWVWARLLEEPKSYEGEVTKDKSPFLTTDATIVMTVACELPFYEGEKSVFEWELPEGVNWANIQIEINNDSDVPIFPRWVLTDQAVWTLPDFSWGSEEYSRGLQDMGRVVELPELDRNENVVVDADPRVQTLVSASMSNPQARWRGNDLLYPIAPGASGSIPVSVRNANHGAALRLELNRWFTRPWSRPLP